MKKQKIIAFIHKKDGLYHINVGDEDTASNPATQSRLKPFGSFEMAYIFARDYMETYYSITRDSGVQFSLEIGEERGYIRKPRRKRVV